MFSRNFRFIFYFAAFLALISAGCKEKAAESTGLSGSGYSVIPAPREVELSGEEIFFSDEWFVDMSVLGNDHIAISSLLGDMDDWYGLLLDPGTVSNKVIRLSVDSEAVQTGAGEGVHDQGYMLNISPSVIEIKGNSDQGVFYGVQTLVQLLKPVGGNKYKLPICTIRDWPSAELRMLHWDTKHHQDHMETLKRYLDWSARFKVNMIGFELEDKFEYPTHPEIGAPGAFTTEELQEIVDYGLERHIQVVPVIQSPAHMAYVLKHPEFKDVRATCERCPSEGLNYQACLCNEETYNLIFDMYQDVINATQGVDYFHVSTDEVYYAGICDKCDPPYRWEDLSKDSRETRSSSWIMFAKRAHDFLQERNRRMMAWVEFPLITEHLSQLPPDIIDGVYQGEAFLAEQKKMGMTGLIYISMQGGGDRMIPQNFGSDDQLYSGGKLQSAFDRLSFPFNDTIPGQSTWESEDPALGVFASQALIARSWNMPPAEEVSEVFNTMIQSVLSGENDTREALSQAELGINNIIR